MSNSYSQSKELNQLQRLLACLVYEVEAHLIGEKDPPNDILDTLATIIEHTPVTVKPLVAYLHRTPPEQQKESNYPCVLPLCQDPYEVDDFDPFIEEERQQSF